MLKNIITLTTLIMLLSVTVEAAQKIKRGELLESTGGSNLYATSIKNIFFWDINSIRYRVVMNKGCRSANAYLISDTNSSIPIKIYWHDNNEIQFGDKISEDGDVIWVFYHTSSYHLCGKALYPGGE